MTFRAERIGSLGTENWTIRKKDSAKLNDLMKFLEPYVGASGRGYLRNEVTGKELAEASVVKHIDKHRLQSCGKDGR
jgi:hypothetical protein